MSKERSGLRDHWLNRALVGAVVLTGCGWGGAQVAAQTLSAADQAMARDIFQQLVTTNTADSTGSTRGAAEGMRDRLLKAGFPAGDMEIVGPKDNRLNLVVRYRAAKGATQKPLLFICHLDVVEAKRSDWTMDPFQLTEKDGFFYGRGTQDVKDSDAALVMSLLLLHREGYLPKRDLIVALTADEETGSNNGVDWLLKNRPDLVNAGVVINPDAGGVELKDGKATELNVEAAEKLYADFPDYRYECGWAQLAAAAGQPDLRGRRCAGAAGAEPVSGGAECGDAGLPGDGGEDLGAGAAAC